MLIILSKSPWTQNYDSVLAVARKTKEDGEKVGILLIQDACIAATITEFCGKLAENNIRVYALKADCETRGLTENVSRKVELIDYEKWVRLTMTGHDKIVSWTS